jgi:hypothetical protein
MRVGGDDPQRVEIVPLCCCSSLPAARKWPMLVMHEPMNTSSTLSPATSDSRLASSGIVRGADDRLFDLGQVDLDHFGVLGVFVGAHQRRVFQPLFHRLARRSSVRASP